MESTIWLTGLHSSGKTTIAEGLVSFLREKNIPVVLLDGRPIRETISHDIGNGVYDLDRHNLRVAHVAYVLSGNNIMNVVCEVSAKSKVRRYARNLIGVGNFVDVYVKCPIEICAERDPDGIYSRYRNDTINNVVGLDIPYEEPYRPSLTIRTDRDTPGESLDKLMDYLYRRKVI